MAHLIIFLSPSLPPNSFNLNKAGKRELIKITSSKFNYSSEGFEGIMDEARRCVKYNLIEKVGQTDSTVSLSARAEQVKTSSKSNPQQQQTKDEISLQ
jgi:hypothetical protein